MSGMWKSITVTALIALICVACSKGTVASGNQPGQTSTTSVSQNPNGELKYKAPEGWVEEKPTSSMRAAQYKLPKAAGDAEDASLVLYYFGQGQGGGTQANIDRWINQMQQPDGSASSTKAKSESTTINGLKVTTVDVSGTYSAEMTPGSGSFSNNANYRMRAAVIETPKGSYFVKLVGPGKTVAQWDEAFNTYLKSFEFK
jgi:hypothetical protein